MDKLNELSIAEARAGLDAGEFTAMELTEACLQAIDNAKELNAFVHVTADRARQDAKRADAAIKAGEAGALTGIPLGIKDLFAVEDVPTQAASRILEGFRPRYESTVTAQLWAAGAVMLGKLNMDEFAMGSSNESAVYGPVVNPWKATDDAAALTPGGSSGGSSAAVAAGLCLGATGTDTGGSIRAPAAFTGTVGLKPTYGRCSRYGIVAFASSLDQAGPMTRTVRDAALLLNTMSGHDAKDSTSAPQDVPDFTAQLGDDLTGKVIGIPKEYRVDGLSSEINDLWERAAEMVRSRGAEVREISLPMTEHGLSAYYVIAPAEASSNLARYDGVRFGRRAEIESGENSQDMYAKTRAEGFGAEVKRRIMIGSYVLSAGFYDAYYTRAQKVRTLVKRDFDTVFAEGVDAILTPTTPTAAFPLGQKHKDPVEMYLNDVFTVTANLAGLPGISIPAGLSQKGLPLGMQLIGKPFDEAGLLSIASQMEAGFAFNAQPKTWWTE